MRYALLLLLGLSTGNLPVNRSFDSPKTPTPPGHPAPGFSIERYQTQKISETVGYFSDANDSLAIGIIKDRSAVFLYHYATGSFRLMEVAGKTGEIFQAALIDPHRFCVFDQFRAYVFDLSSGKFIFDCGLLGDQINYDRYSTAIPRLENEIILPALDPRREITSAAYFSDPESFFYAKLNLTTCTLEKGGSLAADNVYREDFYAVRLRPLIAPLNVRSFLSLFPFNTAVDIVDAGDFSIRRSIDLQPEHFGSLLAATGSSLKDQLFVMQSNAAYRHLLASADGRLLLTQYRTSADTILPPEQYISGAATRISGDKYYELYDLDTGQKIGSDTKAEPGYIPFEFLSRDSLLLYSTTHEGEAGLFLHYARIVD